MPKKILLCILIALLSLLVWIYCSASYDYNKANVSLFNVNSKYYMYDTIIQPQIVCNASPLFIIIVTSYVGHVELRSAHRRVLPVEDLQKLNIARIFLLARIPTKEIYITQEAIIDESKAFRDILQGSFYENYRNLTHKHLMGLHWASKYCNAHYILKVDDDTVFNIDISYKYIFNLPKTNNQLIIGYVLNNTVPRRDKQNKWYVTDKEYARSIYPPYLSGWYYIIQTALAAKICKVARYHQYFWIDDIFVTGLLIESLGVKLKRLPENYWLEYYELMECCIKDMVKKYIKCDYTVGPNGGRNNLLVEFNKAYEYCEQWNNCTIRPIDLNLKKVCVMNRDRTIFSDGQVAEIQDTKL